MVEGIGTAFNINEASASFRSKYDGSSRSVVLYEAIVILVREDKSRFYLSEPLAVTYWE